MSANKQTLTSDNRISKKVTQVANLDETEITITRTKLENCFLKHEKALNSGSDWKTPLGLIITIILVFLTTEFNKNFMGVGQDSWIAIFIIILFASVVWLIRSCVSKYKNRGENIDTLIQHVMGTKTRV